MRLVEFEQNRFESKTEVILFRHVKKKKFTTWQAKIYYYFLLNMLNILECM